MNEKNIEGKVVSFKKLSSPQEVQFKSRNNSLSYKAEYELSIQTKKEESVEILCKNHHFFGKDDYLSINYISSPEGKNIGFRFFKIPDPQIYVTEILGSGFL